MKDLVWKGFTQPCAIDLRGSGTTSASETPITRPNPRQCGHAPTGELNEKRFGDGSSNASPQSGHSSRVEYLSASPSERSSASGTTSAAPRPREKAVSIASQRRARRASSTRTASTSTRNRPPPHSRTRVKPCDERSASASSRGTDAGIPTSNATIARPPPRPRRRRSSKTESGVAGTISRPQRGQKSRAQEAKSCLTWSCSSVIVPTVERELRTGLPWRMAMAGGMPSTESTSGGGRRSRNCRA